MAVDSGSVLVTGVSSGIGLETAVFLAGQGFRVFGTMRDLSRRQALEEAAKAHDVTVELLALDVTDAASVRAAVGEVVQRAGGIYGLVNNAGIQLRGYFEDVTDAEIRGVFETNVFGVMAMTRAVLPHLRAAGRGRIVIVSSIGGQIGSLALTSYCASKFALEGFAESLALELAPLDIHVSLVAPAIVNTEIWKTNRNVAPGAMDPASPYYAWFMKSEKLADSMVKSSPTRPIHVAQAVCRALKDRRPRLRYVVGKRANYFLAAKRLLPFEIYDRMSANLVTKLVTKPVKGA